MGKQPQKRETTLLKIPETYAEKNVAASAAYELLKETTVKRELKYNESNSND